MDDFCKNLIVTDDDVNWGLHLLYAGKSKIEPNSPYPPRSTPGSYYFTWEKGRVIDEFQFIYISEGGGIFENRSGAFKVKAGDVIMIAPNEWHRHKPNIDSGWVENFIGFKGSYMDNILRNTAFIDQTPVFELNNDLSISTIFNDIYEAVDSEKPGYQQIVAGSILKICGHIVQVDRSRGFTDISLEDIINSIRIYLRANVDQSIDFKKLAASNNISYSYFRKLFKDYTGTSPRQFHLSLKLIRSKELLANTTKSVNEISEETGFGSIFYFSRYFKSKVGMSPNKYRKHSS